MKIGGAKANALIIASVVVAAAAIYLWIGFDRSTYYTDHQALQRDADTTAPRNILWRDPEPISPAFDTHMTEADPALDAAGTRLYFARVTERGDTDLFVAERDGAGWGEARPLFAVNTLDNESGPEPAEDGSLVFASDRPGSVGGFDLWMIPPEGGEPIPFGPEINSAMNERDPAIADIAGVPTLFFASDRAGGFDLYSADLGSATEANRIETLTTDANELTPAVSPGGDFLYYASDAEGGAGGFDLYRARLKDGIAETAEHLDEAVNTRADELEPALALEGFALLFARSEVQGGQTDLRRAVSREVELATSIVSRGLLSRLLGLLPWLLLAIAIALLLTGLRHVINSAVWGARVATLGLLARCAVLSITAHAALLVLLSLFAVKPIEGDTRGYSRTRVTIASSSAARDSLAEQLHGGTGAMPNTVMATPAVSPAPASMPSTRPTATSFKASDSVSETDRIQANAVAALRAPASPQSLSTSGAMLPDPLASPIPMSDAAIPKAPAPAETRTEAVAPASRPYGVAIELPVSSVPVPDTTRPSQLTAEAPIAANDVVETQSRTADVSEFSSATTSATHLSPAALSEPPASTIEAKLPTPNQAARVGEVHDVASVAEMDSLRVESPVIPGAADIGSTAERFEITYSDATDDTQIEIERPTGAAAPSKPTILARSDAIGLPVPLSPLPSAPRLPGASPNAGQSAEPDVPDASSPSLATIGDSPAITMPSVSPRIALEPESTGDSAHVNDRLPASATRTPRLAPPAARTPAPVPTPGLALSLPTLDPVIPDPGLIERILSGVVLDASTGETIAGAVIRLDRHPAPDLVTESADAGQFEIAVEGIPDTAAITASAPGYIPQSLNVTENDIDNGVRLTFTLKPIDSTVIALEDEPLVRHLGNDEFSGSSNSRFQRESEGVTIVYRFRLNAEQIELIAEPAIAAMFKGVDVENPVFINGQRIDVLDDSPRDGTFDEQVLVFDADLLRRGVNRLRIEATSRPGTDIDDFELVNPRLLLQADGDTLAIRGIVVDAVTGKPLPAATVRLDRAGAPPLSAVTTGAGSFRIRPGDDLPDQFAVVASHPGYVAGVAAVARDDIENGRAIRIALEPASPLVISMEDKPVVHHLGNDEFDGQINSRFQRTSEGIDKTFTFAVPRALPRGVDDLGRLQLWVKGKERPADLSLNGEVIGKIQSSNPDGSFGLQSIAFPANLLRPGPNTLMIQSRRRSGDVDDFEYVDIRIVILPGGLEVF